MPRAEPNSLDTSLTADPTPCFPSGSDAVMAIVAGVVASAMPAAKTTTAGASCQ